jgi:hypothetical protein
MLTDLAAPDVIVGLRAAPDDDAELAKLRAKLEEARAELAALRAAARAARADAITGAGTQAHWTQHCGRLLRLSRVAGLLALDLPKPCHVRMTAPIHRTMGAMVAFRR